ncbi:MAG: hypothetical protein EBU90_25795 [Proteobacteria bacterium]|nr:hypothetical protein [Pseudomonadota bacterium]NBP16357.1 hypothetical protein [bacterium]
MYTLEEVVEAFNIWRLERENKSTPIPDKLWEMTKTLVPYYKKVKIQTALRISGSQFYKNCINGNEIKSDIAKPDGFAVGTFMPYLSTSINNDFCELTLKGQHKSLQIKINIKNISSVLPLVDKYL